MDQEKIGKFIAECRKDRKLTQEQLAEHLNISKNAVSKWERGLNLPDVSIMQDLCNKLDITLNELFIGEKIANEQYKKKADDNLLNALENSSFTLKEKIKYYNDKWEREHIFEIILVIILIAGFIIYGFIKDNGIQFIFMILGFIYGVFENNRKQAYIEKNAYRKINDKTSNK